MNAVFPTWVEFEILGVEDSLHKGNSVLLHEDGRCSDSSPSALRWLPGCCLSSAGREQCFLFPISRARAPRWALSLMSWQVAGLGGSCLSSLPEGGCYPCFDTLYESAGAIRVLTILLASASLDGLRAS